MCELEKVNSNDYKISISHIELHIFISNDALDSWSYAAGLKLSSFKRLEKNQTSLRVV